LPQCDVVVLGRWPSYADHATTVPVRNKQSCERSLGRSGVPRLGLPGEVPRVPLPSAPTHPHQSGCESALPASRPRITQTEDEIPTRRLPIAALPLLPGCSCSHTLNEMALTGLPWSSVHKAPALPLGRARSTRPMAQRPGADLWVTLIRWARAADVLAHAAAEAVLASLLSRLRVG